MSDPKRKFKPESGGKAKSTSQAPARNGSSPKQAGPKTFGAKKFAPKKFEDRISAAELPSERPGARGEANRQIGGGRNEPPRRAETKPKSRPNSTSHSRPHPSKRTGGGNRRAMVATAEPQTRGERVAKIIARAGACSRRDAEAWIAEGRVAVNGKVLVSPATVLGPNDRISVDGEPLAERQRTRLFLFHKPRGLVTTNKDPEGRPTIFDHLHQHAPDAPRLMSIGRLDINTEGLLLLTNDGGLARILELPATGWLRRYRVRANGETDQAVLDGLAKGVTIDGLRYAGIEATLDRQQGANCWLTLGLREGKNREIKRVLEHLGLAVNRLIRISFGPFQLGDIEEGRIEEVRTRVLRDQLGTALAQAAGVDFDAALETASQPEVDTERANGFGRKIPQSRSGGDTAPRRDTKANAKNPGAGHGKPVRFSANSRGASKAAAPEPEKPRSRPQPGPRKHISALRAERKGRGAEDPRQRIERDEIADRKGRAVTIERRSRSKGGTAESMTQKPAQRQSRPAQERPGRALAPASRPDSQRSKTPRPDAPPRPHAPGTGGKGRRPK